MNVIVYFIVFSILSLILVFTIDEIIRTEMRMRAWRKLTRRERVSK